MGLLDKVVQEEKKQQSSGLLRRANLIRTLSGGRSSEPPDNKPDTDDKKKKTLPAKTGDESLDDPEKRLKNLLRDISELKISVEYPGQFFRAVKNRLQVRKGALLVPEKDGSTLAPWVITGYDKTTEHRMRIPAADIYGLFRGKDFPLVVAEKEKLVPYGSYFSSRESALLDRMLFCGFIFQEKIIGVLLISDSPLLALNGRELGLLFASLEELASPLLFASREEKMRKTRDPEASSLEQFHAGLRKLRDQDEGGQPVSVLSLNVAPLISKIREYAQDLDEYRTFQDLGAVAATILEGNPVFVSGEKKRLLIALDPRNRDVELLLHQLSLALKKFFQELSDGPEPEIIRKNFPDDASDPEALTTALLS